MKPKLLAPLLGLILVLTTTPSGKAQTTTAKQPAVQTNVSDWQGLQDLKPGKQILIEFKSGVGGRWECKFLNVSNDKLTVSCDDRERMVEQADIQSVFRLNGRWSRATLATIGAGVGMVVGTAVGASRAVKLEQQVGHVNSENDEFPAMAGFVIGAGAGAGIGALLGGNRRGKLLYEAK